MDIKTSAPALLTRSVASRIAPIGLEDDFSFESFEKILALLIYEILVNVRMLSNLVESSHMRFPQTRFCIFDHWRSCTERLARHNKRFCCSKLRDDFIELLCSSFDQLAHVPELFSEVSSSPRPYIINLIGDAG